MEKSKVKIVFSISNFDTSGSGKVVYDLAKFLDPAKFEVEIVCKNSKGYFFKEVEELAKPVHFMQFNQPYRPYFNLLFRINPYRKFIKNKGYDIVHSWYWSSDWTEALAVRLAGAKFIYTKKSMSWGGVHWKIKSFLSNFIITTNKGMDVFFPSKVNKMIIPFGVDTNHLKPVKDDSKQKKYAFKIITVANLVPLKSIEDIMKAMHLLDKEDIEFTILGDHHNEYGHYLQDLAKTLKIHHQVFFLGKQLDIKQFLNEADLYIIPSQREGLPVALLEAMSMALPVLGSDIDGIRYVLDDFPDLLFEQGNEKKIAEKILYFYKMSPEERNALGQTIRAYCIKHFSMEVFIQKHEELYLKIVKK
ncbi:glycosyltransferase [Flavobacterium sp.]|uniref:glycosyltransferase n=1 Tax=Flavobacterium sp. TaxID=239 RepID=UPI00261CBA58|nr:glycosyltransferase [Flavobacterium sp.]MDD2986282.1 glycosyltransferase [Flavobacterium sp.]